MTTTEQRLAAMLASVMLYAPTLECMADKLNPCHLSNTLGKHWGGGLACPNCTARQVVSAEACDAIMEGRG